MLLEFCRVSDESDCSYSLSRNTQDVTAVRMSQRHNAICPPKSVSQETSCALCPFWLLRVSWSLAHGVALSRALSGDACFYLVPQHHPASSWEWLHPGNGSVFRGTGGITRAQMQDLCVPSLLSTAETHPSPALIHCQCFSLTFLMTR